MNEHEDVQDDARSRASVSERFHNMMPVRDFGGGMNRSTDQVSRDMMAYVRDGAISEEDHAQLVWLFAYGKTHGVTSYEAVGKLVGYNGATVSRLFAGKYEGSLANVLDSVRTFRHLTAEREKMSGDIFIETSIWEKVKSACDFALTRCAPVRIVGPTQIGKTKALEEYIRRSSATVFYCDTPASPTLRLFMEAVAEGCGVNPSLRNEELRRRIPKAMNRQTLLIVEEIHVLATSGGRGTAVKCMEWLRKTRDAAKCGLVMTGTKSVEDELFSGGGGLKGWLEQMDQRCQRKVVLPDRLPDSDIALAAAAYGFPAPDGSVRNLLATIRMNHLCACLDMASAVAQKRETEKSWDIFAAVYRKNFGGR